jgi:putative transposase
MHLTLKLDATRPAAYHVLQQQMRFDTFLHRLQPRTAASGPRDGDAGEPLHAVRRLDRGLEELDYPFHDWTAVVTRCGRICYQRRKINLSQVFAGQKVGVKQTAEHIWLVTFMEYDLGYFDDETCRLEPIDDPFGPRLLPMSPE